MTRLAAAALLVLAATAAPAPAQDTTPTTPTMRTATTTTTVMPATTATATASTTTTATAPSPQDAMLEERAGPRIYRRGGVVAPARRARLGARMDAAVAVLHAEQGKRFRRGDVLVEFDCSVERAALEEARIAHRLAKFHHSAKRREAENREVLQEQAELAGLQAEAALAALNRARARARYCTITAPFDARVLKVFVAEYEDVKAQEPIVEVAEDAAPRLHLLLPWDWLSWLAPGHEFDVRVAGRDYRARIERLAPEADALDESVAAVARDTRRRRKTAARHERRRLFSSPRRRSRRGRRSGRRTCPVAAGFATIRGGGAPRPRTPTTTAERTPYTDAI